MIKHLLTLFTIGFASLFGEIVPVHIHCEGQTAIREYDKSSSVYLLKSDIHQLFRLEMDHQHIVVKELYGRDWIVTKGNFYQNSMHVDEAHVDVSYCEPQAPYDLVLHLRFVDDKFPTYEMHISSEMTVDELKQEITKNTGFPNLFLLVKDGRGCCSLSWLESGFQIKDYLLKSDENVIIWTEFDD